ncbi:MAG: HD domain-containing protein [Patescibacteria group bacterium]|nr:HD domain-containing protein [Patescibacteria group bacterium]
MKFTKIKEKIPSYVMSIARILGKEGFEAHLVGGGVRDIVMNRDPKDYDLATDALPEDVLKIFPKAVATGAKFGSIIVIVKDEREEPQQVDVTTYRVEEYLAGRWPSKVEFISSLEGDLARRDFTWNAMAIDLLKMLKGKDQNVILDPFDGQEDLERKVVRAVGESQSRMKEDALRALRACRFASVLGFQVESKTKAAIGTVLGMIDNLSAERVRDEFLKTLYQSPKPSVGLELLEETGILKIWIPELLEGVGVDQPKFHAFDVFKHSLRAVDAAEDSVKLAALFHDIAKPRTKEGDHFYRHDVVGAEMTEEIMKRLRFSNREIERVKTLVRWHMFYFPYDEDDFLKGRKIREADLQKKTEIAKWRDAAIRRFVKNVGGEDAVDDLIKLRIADATSNPKSAFDEKEIMALQKRIAEVRAKDMALKLSDLDISGKDLLDIGLKAGPEVGQILRELLDMVIEDPTINDKEKLLEIAKNLILKGVSS